MSEEEFNEDLSRREKEIRFVANCIRKGMRLFHLVEYIEKEYPEFASIICGLLIDRIITESSIKEWNKLHKLYSVDIEDIKEEK